jgi:NDP-sugar pyrophosphorylase family protein
MSAHPSTAFVLGAGLGTRLKALTARLPKPLLPVCNEPLITFAFRHLRDSGVQRFVVNTHWQAHAYAKTFPSNTWDGFPLYFSHESPEVLETAG